MYLDALDPLHAEVGYGAVGRGGDLGYDGMRVTVSERTYEPKSPAFASLRASQANRGGDGSRQEHPAPELPFTSGDGGLTP